MCGIAGFYRMGETPIRDWQITMAANMLEYRGNDATGVALMNTKGRIRVLKNNEQAWKFTSSKAYKEFLAKNLTGDVRIALIHTRKYTKGSPFKNENNHPMFHDAGAIIHNGMIYNDEELFKVNKGKPGWKRSGETDSDAIRAILDCAGGVNKDTIKAMNLLEGYAAIGAIHPATPDKLLLLRDQNPLILGATKDMLMFASDKTTIHKALKPWVKVHNIWMQVHAPDISFVPMPNQSGWIIGPGGFELHEKFECNGTHRTGNTRYNTMYNYQERRGKALAEVTKEKKPDEVSKTTGFVPSGPLLKPRPEGILPRFVVCPSTKCSRHLELDEDDMQTASLSLLKCGECGESLATAVNADIDMLVH